MSTTTALPPALFGQVAAAHRPGVNLTTGQDGLMTFITSATAVHARSADGTEPVLLVVPPRRRPSMVAGTWFGDVSADIAGAIHIVSTSDTTPAALADAVARFDRQCADGARRVLVSDLHLYRQGGNADHLLAEVLGNIALCRETGHRASSVAALRTTGTSPKRPVVATMSTRGRYPQLSAKFTNALVSHAGIVFDEGSLSVHWIKHVDGHQVDVTVPTDTNSHGRPIAAGS